MLRLCISNISGAFADSAVLFPLLLTLALKSGFSFNTLLFTAGLTYFFSGWYFRVPISVQPLKSITLTAVVLGASSYEIRISAAILGVICLLLLLFNRMLDLDRLARKIPVAVIHSLQFSLGILLIMQGISYGKDQPFLIFQMLGAVAVLLFLTDRFKWPVLGWVALISLLSSLYSLPSKSSIVIIETSLELLVRPFLILSLVLPQLALTLTNSVISTEAVTQKYFGEKASRVTLQNLLKSIGTGNILSSLLGGMPFCHGAGGVTAHYWGGARHWSSNLIIGSTLVFLAGIGIFWGSFFLQYPPFMLGVLLISIGVFHLQLAELTFRSAAGKVKLMVSLALTLAFKNLFVILVIILGIEICLAKVFRKQARLRFE